MPLSNMPPCPDSLKAVQHFLTIAAEHDNRDVVVSYWCRFHALQQALKIDKSSPEAKKLLFFLMDWLEAEKGRQKDNEAIVHDIPAQAHIENCALKIFLWADSQDRGGVFNKNVVKAFYTAGMLYTVLETFGELTEEVDRNRKYAKWKAAYIHNCLKSGEIPQPGPMDGEEDPIQPAMGFVAAPGLQPDSSGPSSNFVEPSNPSPAPVYPPATPSVAPAAVPYNIPYVPEPAPVDAASTGSTGAMSPEMIAKAQKYCKFASSALNYDDVPTAITNLQKALSLLITGHDE